jgi:asparagine synthase (glutamine-hydrolysing)
MVSDTGDLVLVFNGEIFNFLELRDELQGSGVEFKTRSDTEVLLACCQQWGVERTVRRLVGMFAFAVWDRRLRTLTLARDRLGIKPLYYGVVAGSFVFASELKALSDVLSAAHLDPSAIAALLRHGYIGAPATIFSELKKLEPSATLVVRGDDSSTWTATPTKYWNATRVAIAGVLDPLPISDESTERLLQTMRTAVRDRMVADVPLGAFLSGGIDSSLVTALMAETKAEVRTFSIGFDDSKFDESRHAARVAKHLHTDHTEFRVSARDALNVLPLLPRLYDEPFADSSQIPTYLVCMLARQYVTVALTGDGGDELFGGYTRYRRAARVWGILQRLPTAARATIAGSGKRFLDQEHELDSVFRLLPTELEPWRLRTRTARVADLLSAPTQAEFYRRFVSLTDKPDELLICKELQPASFGDNEAWTDLPTAVERMMATDIVTYLPGDILTKVDRASMGASLEARVPLLDHRLVELSWRTPLTQKSHRGKDKWVLRELLARYLPRELFERGKQGFAIPLASWLRGELRSWADPLLSPSALAGDGIFDVSKVVQAWSDHTSRRRSCEAQLWSVLMFQAWLDAWESDWGYRPGLA